MSDYPSDPIRGGQHYEGAGLPRGLRINPSTGAIVGVVSVGGGEPDLPHPDAVSSDGVSLLPDRDPPPVAGTIRWHPDDSDRARASLAAILPPGLSFSR
jgi:hypothetical protein